MLSADYQQIELRLIAYLSQDQGLIDILSAPGSDPFRSMACTMFGCESEEQVTDEQRKIVKELWYATIYGMGIKTFSSKLAHALRPVDYHTSMYGNLSIQFSMKSEIEQAKSYLEQFSRKFPVMNDYRLNRVKQELLEKGYVSTLSGRRRYWSKEELTSNDEVIIETCRRNALSTICQGSAADIFKASIILIDRMLTDMNKLSPPEEPVAVILMHIHDELVFEVKRNYLPIVASKIKMQMENAASYFGQKLSLPLPVKLKIGENWGEMADYIIPDGNYG
jgi:DNA polymerase I-like protein with 3'-5' exonuclease and polymerase domains